LDRPLCTGGPGIRDTGILGGVPVIDLNADVGEEASGPDGDGALLDVVTSASVACGFHAGDPSVMRRTLGDAVERGVVVGAHPSYPDRPDSDAGTWRSRPRDSPTNLLYQIGALDGLARAYTTRVSLLKPHGALYHRMGEDEACAKAVCDALRAYGNLALLAPYGSVAIAVAERFGVEVATEAFADRAYLPDGPAGPESDVGARGDRRRRCGGAGRHAGRREPGGGRRRNSG